MTVTKLAPGLRVAELAAVVGVRPDTIRYYERTGLLAPPPRSAAGYRHYPAEVVERIRFVAELLAVRGVPGRQPRRLVPTGEGDGRDARRRSAQPIRRAPALRSERRSLR